MKPKEPIDLIKKSLSTLFFFPFVKISSGNIVTNTLPISYMFLN